MKTFRFRDFTIYNEARAFRKTVNDVIKKFPADERFRLVDQISRSSLSVLLNIAEGSAKATDRDFARFLDIAIGSVNEVVAGFDAAMDDGYIEKQQQQRIEEEAETLAKQIGSFIQRLRNCHKPLATSQQPA